MLYAVPNSHSLHGVYALNQNMYVLYKISCFMQKTAICYNGALLWDLDACWTTHQDLL